MYDQICERAVIGTLMHYNWAYPQEAYRLCEDLFTQPLCKFCYQAIELLAKKNMSFDFILVTAEVRKENPDVQPYQVIELTQQCTTQQSDFSNYVGRLNDLMTRRKIHLLGQKMVQEGACEKMDLDELISYIVKGVQEITRIGIPAGTSTLAKTMDELEQFYFLRQEGKLETKGTSTGYSELDEGGGFTDGQLNIVAGATSHGKTSLALSFVDKAIEQGIPVAMFSLEMGRRELGARFVAMESGVSASLQLNPSRVPQIEEFNRLMDSVQVIRVRGTKLIFDDHFSSNIDQICSSIRSMHYQHHIKGVVIDYLQILGTNKHVSNREQLMGEVARQLKNIAVDLGIWVIALSQLNRDPNSSNPSIDRLRDSGQIAEAADRVIILYRPELNGTNYPKPFTEIITKGTAMLNVVKNRNGKQSRFIVGFDANRTRFYPLEHYPQISATGEEPGNEVPNVMKI